jgi:hypothetical protein
MGGTTKPVPKPKPKPKWFLILLNNGKGGDWLMGCKAKPKPKPKWFEIIM